MKSSIKKKKATTEQSPPPKATIGKKQFQNKTNTGKLKKKKK